MQSVRTRANLGDAPDHPSCATLRGQRGGDHGCGSRVEASLGGVRHGLTILGAAILPSGSRRFATGCESLGSETMPAGQALGQKSRSAGSGLPSLSQSWLDWHGLCGQEALTFAEVYANAGVSEREVLPC